MFRTLGRTALPSVAESADRKFLRLVTRWTLVTERVPGALVPRVGWLLPAFTDKLGCGRVPCDGWVPATRKRDPMKRLLVVLVLVVVTACYGQEGSEGARGDAPATGEAPPTADTLEVTPDTIMARDTAR